MPPAFKVRFPTLIVPGLLPGAIVPPLLIVTSPSVPLPPSVPPLFTVVVLEARLPVTRSLPALIAVAPVKVLLPVSVVVPVLMWLSARLPVMSEPRV